MNGWTNKHITLYRTVKPCVLVHMSLDDDEWIECATCNTHETHQLLRSTVAMTLWLMTINSHINPLIPNKQAFRTTKRIFINKTWQFLFSLMEKNYYLNCLNAHILHVIHHINWSNQWEKIEYSDKKRQQIHIHNIVSFDIQSNFD